MEERISQQVPWGIILVALGLLGMVGQLLPTDTDSAALLIPAGISVTFFLVYLTDRSRWWALIPAWVMLIPVVVIIFDGIPGVDVAIPVMIMGAIPFGVVYLKDREQWWALIPGYIFSAVAIMLFADQYLSIDLGGLAPFLVALPFIVVFLVNPRDNWWALIPGGILASAGVGLVFDSITWVFPILLIAGGIWLIVRSNRTTRPPQPLTGPQADKPRETNEQRV